MGSERRPRHPDSSHPDVREPRVRYELRIALYGFFAPLPAVVTALYFLFASDLPRDAAWSLGSLVLLSWLGVALLFRGALIRPVQTLANLLSALREGDLGIRARGARVDDALGLAFHEINTLGETLRNQRLGVQEASALLRTVMDEIDVAIFAFDGTSRLQLVNRAGERLLSQPRTTLIGRAADAVGLAFCLAGDAPRTLTRAFPGAAGRWELRRTSFRQEGQPHQLVVLADVTRALREEELQAWQRLIRVLSHEINNSLTPIQSIAGSLVDTLATPDLTAEDRDDLHQGLVVIRGRSAALGRFMESYAKLAKLPPPRRGMVHVPDWIRRVTILEQRLAVRIRGGPDITIYADGDQLDQLLINLLRNAVEAALETKGGVEVSWSVAGENLEVLVEDEGPGIPESGNLFVPFFTTKAEGSGIGLALSRQIAEGHGGALTIEGRNGGPGAAAKLVLPIGR